MAAEVSSKSARSLMSALTFLRMSREYFSDVARELDGTQYRKLKMDRISIYLRDAFNFAIAPLSRENREILERDLKEATAIDSIIATSIVLTVDGRAKLEAYANKLHQEEIGVREAEETPAP